MKLVSVIIPVYNVSEYLDKCVKSCLAQTYTNLQIILVDDGSTDDCGEKCDRWAQQDFRISVIHKTNGGLSSARNAGLEVANGEFIYFLDSDDYIEPELIADAVDAMTDDVDMVTFNFRVVDENGMQTDCSKCSPYKKLFKTEDDIMKFIYKKFFSFTEFRGEAWAKIFRKSVIDKYNLFFEDNNVIFLEDMYFSLCYLFHSNGIKCISSIYYNYTLRNGSIMSEEKFKPNIGRLNELSKAVKRHLDLQDGLDIIKKYFPVIHCLIVFHGIDLTFNRLQVTVEEMRKIISDDVPDIDYFNFQLRKAKKFKKEIYKCYKQPEGRNHYSKILYFLDGDYFKCRARHKIASLLLKVSRERQKRLLEWIKLYKSKKCIYILGTEDFGNLGDLKIGLSILDFLNRNFADYKIKEITYRMFESQYINLKRFVKKSDIIILTGGGNTGDLYDWQEKLRQRVIETWPENKKILFPQSVYYTNTSKGKNQFNHDQQLFTRQNNFIIATREQYSYDLITDSFNCRCIFVPDIVLSSAQHEALMPQKPIITFSMRSDIERALNNEQFDQLNKAAKNICNHIKYRNLQLEYNVSAEKREAYINYFFDEFASSRLIITDRLHGMIFSAVTGTPCIVMDNSYHKIKGAYETIKYLPYIFFANTVEEAIEAIPKYYHMGKQTYDNTPLEENFEKLKEAIIE